MRDISPSELEVLQRAAAHVEVYTRPISKTKKKTNTKFEQGCFTCTHDIGHMPAGRGYYTINLAVANGEYWENPHNPSNSIGLVCCMMDKQISEIKNVGDLNDWRYTTYRVSRDVSWPNFHIGWYDWGSFVHNPEIYVRQWARMGEDINHVNTKVNVLDLLGVDPHGPPWDMVVSVTSSRLNGVYAVPNVYLGQMQTDDEGETIQAGVVPVETVRLYGDEVRLRFRDYYSISDGPVLERVESIRKETRKKKNDQTYMHTAWGVANDLTATINPIEFGDT